MALPPGTALGPYVIDGPLGAGGMGEVYRAHDTRLGREVAIKLLPGEFAINRDRIQRFEREARVIAALNHPHICQIYDIALPDRHGTPCYLVLEYIQGSPLRGPMAPADVLPLALQILDALDAAHRRGILHRDLKPANILVTADGGSGNRVSAKLLDFGLAKTLETEPDSTRTVEGTIAGTPGYMSPEQAEGRPVDERSDIFSLGCVLYELLSGRRPFRGATAPEVQAAILRDEPRPVSEVGNVPADVNAIVARCLEKHPGQRFQSARELAKAFAADPRWRELVKRLPDVEQLPKDPKLVEQILAIR